MLTRLVMFMHILLAKLTASAWCRHICSMAICQSQRKLQINIEARFRSGTICRWPDHRLISYQVLLDVLRESGDEDCCYCLSSVVSPSITPCAHLFCRVCITEFVEQHGSCPVCNVKIGNPVASFLQSLYQCYGL